MKARKFFPTCIGLFLISSLVGCGSPSAAGITPAATPPPATPTAEEATATLPPPTSTPKPIHPELSMLATEKRAASTSKGPVLYSVPGMEAVRVANVVYSYDLSMDLYYPPGFDFSSPAPAVVFVNGLPDSKWKSLYGSILKDTERIISWAQLAAASGMIAITYETSSYVSTDTKDAMGFILKEGEWLGVDVERLCLFGASSNAPQALFLLYDDAGAYQQGLRCVVIHYGEVKFGALPKNVALLVVEAGIDDLNTNANLEKLVARAREEGIQVEHILYADGVHGFEVTDDSQESMRILERTLEFMLTNLAGP